MNAAELLGTLYQQPETLVFADVIATIDREFNYTPTQFRNGELLNQAGENEGSCKVFAFAHLAGLAPAHALQLFAEHYQSVLNTPAGSDHQNIRNFMVTGWQGLQFQTIPLKKK